MILICGSGSDKEVRVNKLIKTRNHLSKKKVGKVWTMELNHIKKRSHIDLFEDHCWAKQFWLASPRASFVLVKFTVQSFALGFVTRQQLEVMRRSYNLGFFFFTSCILALI